MWQTRILHKLTFLKRWGNPSLILASKVTMVPFSHMDKQVLGRPILFKENLPTAMREG
jgi:hypothetical protein